MQEVDPFTVLRVVVPTLAGIVTLGIGVITLRRHRAGDVYAGLARPFAAVCGMVAVVGAGYALMWSFADTEIAVLLAALFGVAMPWVVFALRYVGRGGFVTRTRILAGGAVVVATLTIDAIVFFREAVPLGSTVVRAVATVGSVLSLGVLVLVFTVVGLVMFSTYRHDRLSVVHGAVVVLPMTEIVFGFQVTRPSTPELNAVVIGGVFAVVAATLALGVTRFDVLSEPASTRVRGERAALTQTDEAILVVDADERVVRSNRSARRSFGDPTRLSDAVDDDVAGLESADTITCWTDTGRRVFDPHVSRFRDEYGETLGYTVTLIDVTAREIRRQRLQVLNRILRHNVRNQLDVIRAHAEEAGESEVIEGVDRIGRLSEEARRIESLMSRAQTDAQETDVAALVERIVREVAPDADTTVAVPTTQFRLDRAVCEYVLRNLVENAVEHNDNATPRVVVRATETDTGIRFVVADDGPGIPESERAAIETGSEDPLAHATSLGLWGTNWAVGTLGGSMEFTEGELGGTAVVVELPEAARVESA